MKFIADLHVHSKYSRATAKNLDLENLYIAAQLKGITVVGTGDFTHPEWFSEIKEKLVPAEEGLYKLKDEIIKKCDEKLPLSCRGEIRFILQCEICSIYKKKDKTRKNHNIVFVPDFATASRFDSKLDAIGNIKSDGRPILGLDARNLLEILLKTSNDAFLIPAHVWTPWFSVLGSKSGFDSVGECFEDLTPYIFAVETGLSSNPPMNWRVSDLDSLTLVSNSDAHSPMNLGRNANMFRTNLSYLAIREALESGDPATCMGTIDLYPEEGKYHYDGHRNCRVCLHPDESRAIDYICPTCGKLLTFGVLNRVEELASRPKGAKPQKTLPFYSIITLAEILSEIFEVGPKTKKVINYYNSAIDTLGPELPILLSASIEQIEKAGIPFLAEAINRMRHKEIHISPGYDGEYGTIKVFRPEEKSKLLGQQSLFVMPGESSTEQEAGDTREIRFPKNKSSQSRKKKSNKIRKEYGCIEPGNLDGLNENQRIAVLHKSGPLIIIAGPGTGKTRTLTHRIAYIIKEKKTPIDSILAVTFTRKAAQEMKDRLVHLLNNPINLPLVATFHSLCIKILKYNGEADFVVLDKYDQKALLADAILKANHQGFSVNMHIETLLELISTAKQQVLGPEDNLHKIVEEQEIPAFKAVYHSYQNILLNQSLYDYEDLIFKVIKLFGTNEEIRQKYQNTFNYIFIDEYQDLNDAQYVLVRQLKPGNGNICVIGDPNQSIYGFRGSNIRYFKSFAEDYPTAAKIHLNQNYRSSETILEASYQIIKDHSITDAESRIYSGINAQKWIHISHYKTERDEAISIGIIIEKLIGGTGFHSIDFGKTNVTGKDSDKTFSDFAILYRVKSQGEIFAEVFDKSGIPFQMVQKEHRYQLKGIAELISFFKVMEGYGNIIDFERILNLKSSGLSKTMIMNIKNWFYNHKLSLDQSLSTIKRFPIPKLGKANQQKLLSFIKSLLDLRSSTETFTVEKKIQSILEHTEIKMLIDGDRRAEASLNKIIQLSGGYDKRTNDFFETIALQTDPDTFDYKTEKVAFMTMHSAKGLEFPVVFIPGCENGYVPFMHQNDKVSDIDEERRLFYVAMTRAMDKLYISSVKERRIYGNQVPRKPSPFIDDIENTLKKYDRKKSEKFSKNKQIQLTLF